MPAFRKRPVVIEAEQFYEPDSRDITNGPTLAVWCHGQYLVDALGPCILIETLEGQMRANPTDWIIKGVNGEFYPCKADIFAKTYEPA